MTNPRSLLSVRLEPGLAASLERHCAQTGQTRSEVVQQSVAQYLAVTVGPTLGSLAEDVLPALPATPGAPRAPRQQRFRENVRAKRRR
jgi:hypothetical protein